MSVSNELISEFVKVTNDKDEKKNEATQPGTIVKSGDVFYVRLDGSECLTPVNSTVEIEHGDRVNVLIKNHDATVIGNLTKKATGLEKVTKLLEDGSLDIAINGDFTVNAGGTVNLNDRLILDKDGNLSLKVDSFSIGDSEDIDDLDDLKGEPGTPGKDGEDVTSQYVYYKSNYGLAVTPNANSTTGKHIQITNSAVNIKDDDDIVASFTSSSLTLLSDFTMSASTFTFPLLGYYPSITFSKPVKAPGFRGDEVTAKNITATKDITTARSSGSFNIPNHTDCGVFSSACGIMTGSGGNNHGLWSMNRDDWIIYSDNNGIVKVNDYTFSANDITASGEIQSKGAGTSSSAANCRLTTASPKGTVRYAASSSCRYKHDIEDINSDYLAPELLYNLPVRQFIYNDGYLTESDDRNGLYVPGLIAEEVAEHYPIAADLGEEQGTFENWNERYIIPPMLKLIQDQHKQIEELTKRVTELENNQGV